MVSRSRDTRAHHPIRLQEPEIRNAAGLVWIIERMAGQVQDRELHARMSDALVALQSNVQWLIRRYNDGDVEMMEEVELAARRHLAMIRQLLPRVEAAAKRNHPRRLQHPQLPVGPGADRVTAIYQ